MFTKAFKKFKIIKEKTTIFYLAANALTDEFILERYSRYRSIDGNTVTQPIQLKLVHLHAKRKLYKRLRQVLRLSGNPCLWDLKHKFCLQSCSCRLLSFRDKKCSFYSMMSSWPGLIGLSLPILASALVWAQEAQVNLIAILLILKLV